MYSTLIKIIASILAALCGFLNITIDLPGFSKEANTTTTIEYLNGEKGSMDAVINIETTKDGEYKLYWADEDFQKLSVEADGKEFNFSHFAEIETTFGKGCYDIPDYTAIPEDASHILVTLDGETVEIYNIPEEKRADRGEMTYSYGVISDLHFNRYSTEDLSDVANMTFDRALSFYDNFDVSLVAMPGDISTDGEKESFKAFSDISSKYDFPVYTATGNHDMYAKHELKNWQEYMNKGVYGENKSEDVLNVSENGLDFVYREPVSGDIFIFLCQTSTNYGLMWNALLTDAQLDWLETQFETYKDEHVNLFFHTFLVNPNGKQSETVGNLMNNVGSMYYLFYTMGATDEVRFRSLLRQYDNVTFFSGHSHWAYYLQEMNDQLNISDYNEDGATYVHVSSVSCPRTTDLYQPLYQGNEGKMSEGYLVQVYEDSTVLIGVDFVTGELLAYAQYEIER